MNRPEFHKLIDDTFMRVIKLSESKGKDYAGDADVLANFKRHAASLGLTKEQIWAVYAGKHWDAITAYCKAGQVESEPIESRIIDIIVYSILLLAMTKEEEPTNDSQTVRPQ